MHRKRKVGSYLDKTGTKFLVIEVEVVVLDADALPREAKIDSSALLLRFARFEGLLLLQGNPTEITTPRSRILSPHSLGHFILAFSPLEGHHRDVLALDKGLHLPPG